MLMTNGEITDDLNAHLEAYGRMFMVTRRKDGSPTCHPMARFYADREVYMNMYAASAKHRNLTRDDRITCLITTNSDDAEFRAVVLQGAARHMTPEETLASDRPGARLARTIGMEGVKEVKDAPEKFVTEEPTDWLKRAAVMLERIRDGVRVLWHVEPKQAGFLDQVRR
jgi:nitroimidazol reductase NimA-like FMN-containing flavoprotein (pyridoxamine 5'-phosphate oxidase superfamily)